VKPGEFGRDFSAALGNLVHAGHARTAPQLAFQRVKLVRATDRVHLDAPIE
jgi:hypothetical protein